MTAASPPVETELTRGHLRALLAVAFVPLTAVTRRGYLTARRGR